jgi:hypothetical protein
MGFLREALILSIDAILQAADALPALIHPVTALNKRPAFTLSPPACNVNLRNQQARPLRCAAFQNLVCASCVGEGKFLRLRHFHFDHAAGNQREQLVAGFFQLLAICYVAVEGRAGRIQRTFLVENTRLTPDTGPEALPKLTIRPRRCRQSSESSQVSFPTESYTTRTFSRCYLFYALNNVFFAIVNHLPCASL